MKQVRLNGLVAAGALGADAIISGTLIPASDSEYRCLSLDYAALWADISAAIDGGAAFGVAHGDYTDTEIFEAITAAGSISRGDKILNEKANRLVRVLGFFQGGIIGDGESVFNDGRRTKVRLNWFIPIGKTVKLFIWNNSDTIWSSGSNLTLTGNATVAYQ